MPRRDDEFRNIGVVISGEAILEALAAWTEQWHGDKIDLDSIEFDYDPDTKKIRKATAVKKAVRVKTKTKSETAQPITQKQDHERT